MGLINQFIINIPGLMSGIPWPVFNVWLKVDYTKVGRDIPFAKKYPIESYSVCQVHQLSNSDPDNNITTRCSHLTKHIHKVFDIGQV